MVETTVNIPGGPKCYEGEGKDTVFCPFGHDGVDCRHPEVNSEFAWDNEDGSKHPKCPGLKAQLEKS